MPPALEIVVRAFVQYGGGVKDSFKYFRASLVVTVLGLIAGGAVGFIFSGTIQGMLNALFLTLVLAVIEVSLSFDDAVANAVVLRRMSPLWRQRFTTWGMLVAVFGMRLFFPLAVVSAVAWISPWEALRMAALQPDDYARVMLSSHSTLVGFGASFLLMVSFKYFFDSGKTVHWLSSIERRVVRLGTIRGLEYAVCAMILLTTSLLMANWTSRIQLLAAAAAGLLTFAAIDGLSRLLNRRTTDSPNLVSVSVALFFYLELLDASYSFDGVIGAFAVTSNLFIIMAGLAIGAMFVRSLTVLLVERQVLQKFRFVEHGAFYAVAALALVMLSEIFVSVPEVVSGLIGTVILGLSLIASVRDRHHLTRYDEEISL